MVEPDADTARTSRGICGKAVLSEAEAADYEKRLLSENDADVRAPGTRRDVNTAVQQRLVGSRQSDRRRSSNVAHRRSRRRQGSRRSRRWAGTSGTRTADRRSNVEERAASWLDFDVYSRCIMRSGLPRLSTGYNNNYEIVQTPGYVAIFQEQIHENAHHPLSRSAAPPGHGSPVARRLARALGGDTLGGRDDELHRPGEGLDLPQRRRRTWCSSRSGAASTIARSTTSSRSAIPRRGRGRGR
jgi:hypothetical protein